MEAKKIKEFQNTIWKYYKTSKRDMPWRETTDPYKILVSEIMLQQTQVFRVIPKYIAFLKNFPDFETLAKAPLSQVLKLWQGLGYNRRAKFLLETAKIVTDKYSGVFPETIEEIDALPGIGQATAAAILAYSRNIPVVYIETNIRRVYIHFFISKKKKISDASILEIVAETVDKKNAREWYWALMDYGAKLKREVVNPNRKSKHYAKQSTFEGSNRQIRGRILKLLVKEEVISVEKVLAYLRDERGAQNIFNLITEGFIEQTNDVISLKK